MKALSDILTRMLMLMLLILVACTNDDADEVTTPPAQEQYVTVRMNVPDMTVTASRAADGVIESITALSFGANGLLEVNTINSITNANVDGGYNGTFTLSVPQGTSTIHFLANLPYDVELPTEMGGSEVDVMTSLTTGDHDNLCYWGMADYNGNGSLFVTLYRNMAKITLASDPDFPFEGDSLYIAGLDNANESGKLVPYDNGFTFDSNSEFRTIPDGVTQLDASPLGTNDKEYGGYGRFLYVFEHENSNYEDKGLFVICQIGDAFYKVALTSDGVTPYPIIRNHEYIIYVSDVDDYQSNTYRSTTYYGTFEKDPINLEVWEIVKEDITAEITAGETLYYDSDDAQTATVSVTVPAGVSTLHIEAADFNFNGEDSGSYTYAVNGETNISLTFTLKNGITEPKTSTITISDANDNANPDSVDVTVMKTPVVAFAPSAETIYLNGGTPNSLNVTMNGNDVPNNATVSLTITAPDFTVTAPDFTVTAQNGTALTQNGNVWTYNGTLTTLVFTPTSAGVKSISITGDGVDINVPEKSISVTVNASITATPTSSTIYYDGDDKTVTVSVTIPKGVSGLNISAADFSVALQNENGTLNGNAYTPNDTNGQTAVFVFTYTGDSISSTSIIEFSDADNSEYVDNAEVSISVTKTPAQGEENVIWGNGEGEGNTPIDWSGFTLSSELLEGYEGKILKMVVLTDNTTEYKQMHVDIMDGYSPTRLISFESNDYSPNELLEFDIELPNDLKDGLKITGYGVTFKKFYFNNNSTSSE